MSESKTNIKVFRYYDTSGKVYLKLHETVMYLDTDNEKTAAFKLALKLIPEALDELESKKKRIFVRAKPGANRMYYTYTAEEIADVLLSGGI